MKSNKLLIFDNDISQDALNHYSSKPIIACDTETRGLMIPRDRLCLIQICDEEDYISVVRFIGKEAFNDSKQPNLVKLLKAESVMKLFHYARFDLSVLKYYLKVEVEPVFCTKIASKLVRTYSDRHSLKDLTNELLGITLDKSNQTSDWAASDLTQSQIEYAANDVKVLIPLYNKLAAMLKRENLMDIACELAKALKIVTTTDLMGYHSILEH